MGWMENGISLKKGKVFRGIGEDPKFCRMKYSKWRLSTHSRFTIWKKKLRATWNNSTLQLTAQQLSSNLRRLKWPADFGKRFVSVSSPAKNPMGFHRNKHDITIAIITLSLYIFPGKSYQWPKSNRTPSNHIALPKTKPLKITGWKPKLPFWKFSSRTFLPPKKLWM